jgi:hypothetical protein
MCSATHSVALHPRWAKYHLNRQLTAGAVWNCKHPRGKLIIRGLTLSAFTLIEPVVIRASIIVVNAVLAALCPTGASIWPLSKRQALALWDVHKQVLENANKVLAVGYRGAGGDGWDSE